MRSFEDCIEKVSYGNKIQRTEYLSEGKYPVVSQESKLVNGFWNNEADVFDVDKPVIVFGDHTRTLKFIDFSFVLGADGAKIIKPKSFVDSKFFYYFLQANPLGEKGYARHYRFLKELNLNVPPLPIQQKVVTKLDAIFAEIDKAKAAAEANAKNAEALISSQISKLFNELKDEIGYVKLGDICSSVEYGSSSKSEAEGKVPVLRMGNILNGKLDYSDLVFTNNEDEIKKYQLSNGDVLFNRTNSPLHVGKSAAFYSTTKTIFAGYLIRINYDKKKVIPEFLTYYLNWRIQVRSATANGGLV